MGGTESAEVVRKRQLRSESVEPQRHGGVFAQGRKSDIIGNSKRTPGTREDGGLPLKMRRSLPGVAPLTASSVKP